MTPADPIVEQVDRLIGNLLARRHAVRIEGVGSLTVERQAARRLSRTEMLPPRMEVRFTKKPQGQPLDELVAEALRRANPKAGEELLRRRTGEIVARWLSCAADKEAKTLTIGGVGSLQGDEFRMEEAFDRRLNPRGMQPVKIRRRSRFDWVTAFGLCAALLTVGGAAWWIAEQGLPFGAPEQNVIVRTSRPAPDAALPADTLRTTADTLAATTLPAAGEERAATNGTPPADAAGNDTQSPNSMTAADQSGNDTQHADRTTPADSRGNTAQRTDATAQRPEAGPTRGEESDRTSQNAARREADATIPAPLASGRHYVVLGVFSTPDNAARAVLTAAEQEGTFRCGVYRFGEKFMVSPFESEDREACTLFIRAHAEQFPGMWTYTAR